MDAVVTTARKANVSRDTAPLAVLAEGAAAGIPGALVTISQIIGGAPRGLGTQMAVLADGRHVGHISGGCVEPAVAAEIVPLIASGSDTTLRFGPGSRFIDIRFPCGGGVDLLVHVRPDAAMVREALALEARREPFAIGFEPGRSAARLLPPAGPTGWQGETFVRRYLPPSRLLLIGRGPDFEAMARVAAAAEFELVLATPDEGSVATLRDLGVPVLHLTAPGDVPTLPIDAFTATVLVFHEHEWEGAILARAAVGEGFYVGAIGSVATQRARLDRLRRMAIPEEAVARVRGPIGLIDRAREPGLLALSVLAEIAAVRAERDRA